ncbi:MAG TPA: ABC transporter permease [Ktedonobacterales bacterium]|jgi:ABC-2 type transport system permease protein
MPEPERPETKTRAGRPATRRRYRVLAVGNRWRGEFIRQSSLFALVVLGPFLLLALFAVGFRLSAFRPSAILVAPLGGLKPAEVRELPYVRSLNVNVDIQAITEDEGWALSQVRQGNVDMVITLPENPALDLTHGQRTVLTITVNVVNPLLRIALYNAINQQIAGLNAEAVTVAIRGVQTSTHALEPSLLSLNREIQALDPKGDPAQNRKQLDNIIAQLQALRIATLQNEQAQKGTAADIYYAAILGATDQAILAAQTAEHDVGTPAGQLELMAAQQRSAQLLALVQDTNAIPAATLAIPFEASITNLASSSDDLTAFYGPAALALLLQHLGATLAALSMVQDRQLGMTEFLAVSPATSGEMLLGRFLQYGGVTLGVGLLLTLLLVFLLGIPFAGSLIWFGVVLALLVWASVAMGFCLSLITRSDAQAVQAIMLLLVGAIFFSGFIGPLRALAPPARQLAYLFPLTYGIDALDKVMLLGAAPGWTDLLGLGALAIALTALAAWLFRRELRPK